MKKKMMLSIAAATALLMGTPGLHKADAASNTPECQNTKVVYYQSGNLNQLDLNAMIQRLLKQYPNTWNQLNVKQPSNTQKPAQKPVQAQAVQKPVQAKPVQKPVQAKPVQKPVQTNQKVQKPATTATQAQSSKASTNSQLSAYEQKVVELTNVERKKNGLSALQVDVNLSKVAREKSNDMQRNKYFDHNSPTYGSPFDMMKKFGITYRTAGENIAMGQRTPEEVVQAWMNSSGHRANILNANYTHIGVGYAANGNYWTQEFIGK